MRAALPKEHCLKPPRRSPEGPPRHLARIRCETAPITICNAASCSIPAAFRGMDCAGEREHLNKRRLWMFPFRFPAHVREFPGWH